MAQRPQLSATPRPHGRKAILHALRRGGRVPAVIYGHKEPPQTLSLDAREVDTFLRYHATSALIDLQVDGGPTTAMFKQVEHHPVTGRVWHIDIQRVSLEETVHVSVPLTFHGVEEVEREGGVLTYQTSELAITCRADQMPDAIPVEVAALRPGDLIRIGDLQLPEGIQVGQAEDTVVVACTASVVEIEEEAEEAEAEPETVAAPGAGEGGEAAE
jgi:large subunit ribosomal protein L25